MQGQYELNKSDWDKFYSRVKDIQAKNESEKYYILLKRKNRSYEQLKLYWGEWLPAILYFLKSEIKLNNVEELHIYLKEYYCYSQNRSEYFKEVSILGKKRYICFFSIDFSRCKQEVFNEYMDFVSENYFDLVNIASSSIDDLVIAYNSNAYT